MTDRQILLGVVDAVLHLLRDARRREALELACRRSGAVPPGTMERAEAYLNGFPDDDVTRLKHFLENARGELT